MLEDLMKAMKRLLSIKIPKQNWWGQPGMPKSWCPERTAIRGSKPFSSPEIQRLITSSQYKSKIRWVLYHEHLLFFCPASLVTQLIKNPPAMLKTWVLSLGWEVPLEKGKATHSSILAWRILWTVCSGKDSDTTEQLSLSFFWIIRVGLILSKWNHCGCFLWAMAESFHRT